VNLGQRTRATLLVPLAGLTIVAVDGWADQGESILERSPPLVIGHTLTLQSSILEEERKLLVSLPTGYGATDQPLPVIYLLDARAHFPLTTATVGLLVRNARMPRSIVVGIANTDRGRDFTSVAVEGLSTGGADRFLDFLEHEVVPFIDGNFRTAPHRTLIGHSLGGLLVMNVLAERPDLFQAAIAISPAVTNDERRAAPSSTITERLEVALTEWEGRLFSLFVTMSGGEDDRWVEDFEGIHRVLMTSAPDELSWEFLQMAGEDHGTTVLPSIDRGLRFIHADWDTSGLVREGTLDDLIARFESMSARLGFEVRPIEVMVNLLGYRLLGEGRIGEAVEAFEYNVSLYPDSANVHDSLGEGLERRGSLPGALRNYRRAVSRAEASGDPLLPVFRGKLSRVESLLEGQTGGARIFATPLPGSVANPGSGPESMR
jgi:predicted alpha/beta superfamily hydrolase